MNEERFQTSSAAIYREVGEELVVIQVDTGCVYYFNKTTKRCLDFFRDAATVTEFLWINPHPLIKADYKDEQGNVQQWTMEMGSTVSAQLIGWSRSTLQPGDVVTLYVWQAKTGANVGRFNKVDFPDGTTMRDTQRGGDDGGRADGGVRN